ncbi:HYC_CC_PP family protein [Frigoriflavimonas asaccharolytica]|uniref:Uncharacterized protein n=1 Tax=Frigoriflavimonas asaccharolytica TaxID=2735899 RepID=A0A8J8G4T5_9FLAO|nr:hypothetical protein [Frigoriflavimonas asaccharolytica]NRS91301.1 hypothetical protein [Frigoriflavimonas asaccharolytica]
MKKQLAILFTIFYFGFSSGMVFNVHYCLDKIFVSTASSNSCKLCGTKEKKDCCKSEAKFFKADPAQKADVSFISDTIFFAEISQIYSADFPFSAMQRNEFIIDSNAPPDRLKVPLFITYCNFRI